MSDNASGPRVSVPAQPSPPILAQKQASYKLSSSTQKSRLPNSRYIHPSWYHTRSIALEKILIQEYDHHIAHLYHPVSSAKKTYDYLHTQDPVKSETSFSNEIRRLAQAFGTHMKS